MARPAINHEMLPMTLDNKRGLIQSIGVLPTDGKPYSIKIEPKRVTRSNRANAYYWACVVAAFHDFLRAQGESYTAEDCHEFFKCKHLLQSLVNHETGEVVGRAPRSTASLSTDEFCEYLDRCVVWLQDTFGIVVPQANDFSAPPPPKRNTQTPADAGRNER